MARSQLYALIRSAGDASAQDSDTALLSRYLDNADQEAFAELVRRYSRLIWGQCRHLLANEADADDAFQATFFALAKSARAIRTGERLGPWLHAVAYRVCMNSHRAAARRKKRERGAASQEGTAPVADSTWDRAAAALHEEVHKLPESLRVPFVLCCLEGKAPTVAALQLGLKWGTFAARLSRAKQRLLDRLSERGLGAGVIVGAVGTGTVASAAVVERAVQLGAVGASVPPSILSLATGVSGMFLMRTKLSMVLALAFGVAGVATLVQPANSNLPAAIPVARAAPVPMESVEVKWKKLEELWKLLIEHDEALSTRTIIELATRPKNDVVVFFAGKLKPLKLTEERAKKLIADMGAGETTVVEAAIQEMQTYDLRLALSIDDILSDLPQGTHRQRLASVLTGLPIKNFLGFKIDYVASPEEPAKEGTSRSGTIRSEYLPDNPMRVGNESFMGANWVGESVSELSKWKVKMEWVRATRAVLILDHLGTPDAIRLLESMATGHADASPTKAATEGLVRLKKK